MTPYELSLHILDYNERMKLDQEERLMLAYATAYWGRAKKMPSLKKLLGQEQKSKQQTPDDMLQEIKRLNAAMGGTTF